MDTQHSKINPSSSQTPSAEREPRRPDSGRLFGGIVIVVIGCVWLARQVGMDLPFWLFRWQMLLIGLGIFIGARSSFRNPGWIILVAIGSVSLIDYYYHIDLWHFFWPVFIIGVGLFMILRSRRSSLRFRDRCGDRVLEGNEEVLDSVTVFGGVKKNIISKTFRGGEAVTIFGGTEINLMQADSPDKIVLEIVQIFGGTKLVVPAHWQIHTDELVTVFGGLNDKRLVQPHANPEEVKTLVLKGTCIFGGIDVKSF